MTTQTPSGQRMAFCLESRSLDELCARFCGPFVVCPLGCVNIPCQKIAWKRVGEVVRVLVFGAVFCSYAMCKTS